MLTASVLVAVDQDIVLGRVLSAGQAVFSYWFRVRGAVLLPAFGEGRM